MMTPSFQAKIAEKLDDQGCTPSHQGEGRDEQVLRSYLARQDQHSGQQQLFYL